MPITAVEKQRIETYLSDPQKFIDAEYHHYFETCIPDGTKLSRLVTKRPLETLKDSKLFPSVNRIDDAMGDRNFLCSCVTIHDAARGRPALALFDGRIAILPS